MKKFFKALALVLALTLVIGSVPAAAAETYSVKRTQKTLYVATAQEGNNEATARGTKLSTGEQSKLKQRITYASILGISKKEAKKLNITTDVKADPADCVVANDDTKAVKAYGIGTATITFKVDGVPVGSTEITAKKSATEVLFGASRDLHESGKLTTNTAYELSLPRNKKTEDGVIVPLDTDNRRIVIKDGNGDIVYNVSSSVAEADTVNKTDVVTVVEGKDANGKSNRLWTITFLKAGKYTIVGQGYQSKKYNGTTAETLPLEFEVSDGIMEGVDQTTAKAFQITFSSEELAKKAADITNKQFGEGAAAVTEDEDIIKVFEMGEAGEAVAMFIAPSVTVTKNVAYVTMGKDFVPGTTYRVEYGMGDSRKVDTFVAVEWIPDYITVKSEFAADKSGVGGKATLKYTVWHKSNKDHEIDVDITDKVVDYSAIEYTDNKAAYTKYVVINQGQNSVVEFFENDTIADLKVDYNYYGPSGYAGEARYKFTTIPYVIDSYLVTALDSSEYVIDAWDIAAIGSDLEKVDTDVHSICYEDGLEQLRVKISKNKGAFVTYGNDPDVTFISTNVDKLAIDEDTAQLYAVKAANDTIGVYVYYKNVPVDADPETPGIDPLKVTIIPKRVLRDFKVSYKENKLAYNSGDVYDNGITYPLNAAGKSFDVTMNVIDSTGKEYKDVTFKFQLLTTALEDSTYLNPGFNGKGVPNAIPAIGVGALVNKKDVLFEKLDEYSLDDGTGIVTEQDGGKSKLVKFAAANDTGSIKTVTVKITVTDNNKDASGKQQQLSQIVSFTVKDTSKSEVVRKVLKKTDAGVYTVIGQDKEGYDVCGYYIVVGGNAGVTKAQYENAFKDTNAIKAAYKAADAKYTDEYIERFSKNNEYLIPSYMEAVAIKDGKNAPLEGFDRYEDEIVNTNYKVAKSVRLYRDPFEEVTGGGLTKINKDARIVPVTGSALAVFAKGAASGSALLLNVAQYAKGDDGKWWIYIDDGTYLIRLYSIKKSAYVASTMTEEFKSPRPTLSFFQKNLYTEKDSSDVLGIINENFTFSGIKISDGKPYEYDTDGDGKKETAFTLNNFIDIVGSAGGLDQGQIFVSYVQEQDAITLLYVYFVDHNGVVFETLINRTVKTSTDIVLH